MRDPSRVSGGSSSGSAVAVALGIADFGLGTDTAGSGRVTAAFQGIVGIKPTRGLVSTRGVLSACRTVDCVSAFAPTVEAAAMALATVASPDRDDPMSRSWPRRPSRRTAAQRSRCRRPDRSARACVTDSERLGSYRLAAEKPLRGYDALVLPTVPSQPTIEQVTADPIEINRRLGVYGTFCNLLDMCATALPAGTADGGQFGVTLFAPAFHDWVLVDVATRFAVG